MKYILLTAAKFPRVLLSWKRCENLQSSLHITRFPSPSLNRICVWPTIRSHKNYTHEKCDQSPFRWSWWWWCSRYKQSWDLTQFPRESSMVWCFRFVFIILKSENRTSQRNYEWEEISLDMKLNEIALHKGNRWYMKHSWNWNDILIFDSYELTILWTFIRNFL